MKVKIDIITDIFCTIIVFLYVFMFRIYGVVDSSIVAAAIIMLLSVINKKAINCFSLLFMSKRSRRIYFAYFMIMLWIFFIEVINSQSDFSYIKTLLHGLVQIIIGYMVFSYISGRGNERKIIDYLILSFLIQTFIEWLALINPQIKRLIYLTKDIPTIIIADRYSGIRGLSLSGSSFFGLAIAFGLIFIIFFSEKNTLFKKKPIYKFILFCVLISGDFFAGRTGLISIVLIGIYFLIKGKKHKIKKKHFFDILYVTILLSTIFAIFSLLFDVSDNVLKKIGYLFDYVFEMFISIKKGLGMTTTSSSEMFSQMYFIMPISTIIVGDGLYTMPSGAYYMGTDVGLMRVVLYGGIPLLCMLFYLQNLILESVKSEHNIYILIWLYLIICQAKGEAIGFSLLSINVLVLFSLNYSRKHNFGFNQPPVVLR